MSVEDADTLEVHFNASIEKARHLISVDRSDLAERVLREGLTQRPDEPLLHALLAIALYETQRPEEAEDEAKLALRLDPECSPALRILAVLRTDAGRHREAEELILDALRLSPNDPDALVAYASLMLKTGHLDKAERLTQAALREDPEHAEAHSFRAIVLSEKRKRREAAVHSRHGLALEPETPLSHLSTGITYLKTGRPFSARRHLREALRMSPGVREFEEAYLETDMACRWICLPMYYFELLIERLPGRQFTLWGIVVVLLTMLRGIDGASPYLVTFAVGWLLFCVYTWLASPLGKLWVRLRPPR